MARGLGIPVDSISEEDQYVLDGLNDRWSWEGRRWVRLSAEFPETVNSVEFYRNGNLVDLAFGEPFYVNYEQTWIQRGTPTAAGDVWKAVVHLVDGRTLEREATVR